MSKRPADTQLTREALESDEPSESQEPTGGVQVASLETLATRKILKAKRKRPLFENHDEPKEPDLSSPFAVFLTKPLIAPNVQTGSQNLFNICVAAPQSPADPSKPAQSSSLTEGHSSTLDDMKKKRMIAINQSFREHLKKSLETNASIDLRRNCDEYVDFVSKVNLAESEDAPAISSTTTPFFTSICSLVFPSKVKFDFSGKLDSNFKFGSSGPPSNTVDSSAAVSLAEQDAVSTASDRPSSCSIESTAPSAPCSVPKADEITREGSENVEENAAVEQPCKMTDARAQENEESIYCKVIKLFYLKDKKFESIGKGTLYVKKLASGKNQLLVRGENALAPIWLNVVLDKAVAIKRQGKKDVQCVCFTKPPEDDDSDGDMKYVTYLLRTAGESDADDVHSNLTKLQA